MDKEHNNPGETPYGLNKDGTPKKKPGPRVGSRRKPRTKKEYSAAIKKGLITKKAKERARQEALKSQENAIEALKAVLEKNGIDPEEIKGFPGKLIKQAEKARDKYEKLAPGAAPKDPTLLDVDPEVKEYGTAHNNHRNTSDSAHNNHRNPPTQPSAEGFTPEQERGENFHEDSSESTDLGIGIPQGEQIDSNPLRTRSGASVEDPANPIRLLLPYQRKWVEDQSRFKIWNKSRQIGGSFASAFEIVLSCLAKQGDVWIVLSKGEDQVKEYFRTLVKIINIFKASYQFKGEDFPEPQLSATNIEFPNKSRIIGRPANPGTARGYSGNVLMDEFAFHEYDKEIWAALYPIIANPLRGELKLRIISTPNGVENMFYDLCVGDNNFSKHQTTVHDAVAAGLELDIEQLRKGLPPSAFQQEFEGVFLGDDDPGKVFSPLDVDHAVDEEIAEERGDAVAFCDFAAGGDECVFACMVGNKVLPLRCWRAKDTMESVGRFILLFKEYETKYGLQVQNIYGDAGGLGMPMLDRLAEAGFQINRVNNGTGSKDPRYMNLGTEIYFKASETLQKRSIILPRDNTLIEQLKARKWEIMSSGKLRLESKAKLVGSPDRADAVAGCLWARSFTQYKLNYSTLAREYIDEEEMEDRPGFWAG